MTDLDATYADWYVWAKRNLANDNAVCHAAAAAATEVEARGGSRDEAIAAARHSTTTGAHLASPEPGELRRRSYAEWFDWARRDLGGVREQQHAAARAALAALDSGQGANAAMAAARAAAGVEAPTAPAPNPAVSAPPAAPASAGPAATPAYGPPPPAFPGGSAPAAYGSPAYGLAPYAPPASSFAGYAGFWRRVGAYLIDSLVLFFALLVVSFLFGVVYGVILGLQGQASFNQQQLASILTAPIYGISLLSSWLYYTLFESSAWQATLGKRAIGILVTDTTGQRISWGRANGRYFAKLISSLICGLGYLPAAFSQRKQALHDMIASTLVVRRA